MEQHLSIYGNHTPACVFGYGSISGRAVWFMLEGSEDRPDASTAHCVLRSSDPNSRKAELWAVEAVLCFLVGRQHNSSLRRQSYQGHRPWKYRELDVAEKSMML